MDKWSIDVFQEEIKGSINCLYNNLLSKVSHLLLSSIQHSLSRSPPSLELETIFKCYMAYTTFVSGSALKWEDLRRVAVRTIFFFSPYSYPNLQQLR